MSVSDLLNWVRRLPGPDEVQLQARPRRLHLQRLTAKIGRKTAFLSCPRSTERCRGFLCRESSSVCLGRMGLPPIERETSVVSIRGKNVRKGLEFVAQLDEQRLESKVEHTKQ